MSRVYRFFTKDLNHSSEFHDQLTLGDHLEADIFWQLTKVLRVKTGDTVCLLAPVADGKSNIEFYYNVLEAHKKAVVLSLIEQRENLNELSYEMELILCLPNSPDKLSLILQKAVELGAASITLVSSDNSRMSQKLREDRLKRIVREAAEQSERAVLPTITLEDNLTGLLQKRKALPKKNLVYAAVERLETQFDNNHVFSLVQQMAPTEIVSVLIGPEGGFSTSERETIQSYCFPFSLGSRILRMETAAILALGIFSLKK